MNELECQAAVDAVQKRLGEGTDTEELIAYLRRHGLGKIETMSVLHRCGIGSLAELKDLVHFSQAWQDTRMSDDAFHAQLEQCLDS